MTKPVHPPPEPVDVTEPVYLADTSVYVLRARHPLVRRRFESLLGEGRLATCQVITLEYLNNVPDPEGYQTLWEAMYAQLWIDVTSDAMDRALDVHRALAEKGGHLHFRLPDLIIAATAEVGGAALLHYDPAYDRIAEVTGQPMEWVVPQGSL